MEPLHNNEAVENPKDQQCLTCLFYGRISGECARMKAEKNPTDTCQHWADRRKDEQH